MTVRRQLPLAFSSSSVASFDNFYRGANELAVDLLQQLGAATEATQVFLWGPQHSGKSHLLRAAHNEFIAAGNRSFYVSLKEPGLSSELLHSLEGNSLVAIDDVDHVAGSSGWEQALFNLINFNRELSGRLIFSAYGAPASVDWKLPDLQSRLGWGPVIKLEALSDVDVRRALLMAVEEKGLQMPAETVDYLLKRHSRDVSSLLETVALVDRESLAAGRARITIPFLKSCLSLPSSDG